MFVSLRSISLPAERAGASDDVVARLRQVAPSLPGVTGCWVAPATPGATINAGEILWRMTFTTEAAALAAPFGPLWQAEIAPLLEGTRIDGVGYRITRSGGALEGAGIWRALVFRVMPHADAAQVRALESGLLLFPKYIDAIRSWALSPVAYNEGVKGFTHVWEQQFDGIAGLTGPYMNDPLHWGLVDAWFDAEYPDYIVDPQLVQLVGAVDTSIML